MKLEYLISFGKRNITVKVHTREELLKSAYNKFVEGNKLQQYFDMLKGTIDSDIFTILALEH